MGYVWFVDPDQSVYGALYRRLFANPHYQLELMASAEALFTRLQQGPLPDVIVLEKYQPDMDGLRICSLFRQLRACHDIPLLLVSEAEGLQDQEQARQLGAFDYLRKPFPAEVLRERVMAALQLRQTYRQLQQLFESPAVNSEAPSCDRLTRLPGLGAFQMALQALAAEAREEQPVSLSFVDLDFFNFYQQAFGPESSDKCLQKLADLLRRIAPADSLYRTQLDRFAILIRPQHQHEALKMSQKICERTRLMNIPHASITGQKQLSASIGTATLLHSDRFGTAELVQSAEQALYQAKTWGRNQVRQFFEL